MVLRNVSSFLINDIFLKKGGSIVPLDNALSEIVPVSYFATSLELREPEPFRHSRNASYPWSACHSG